MPKAPPIEQAIISFLNNLLQRAKIKYAITPIKILGRIDISGLIKTGLPIIQASTNEQQPNIVPPKSIPFLPKKSDSATANGKVRIAGVNAPNAIVSK